MTGVQTCPSDLKLKALEFFLRGLPEEAILPSHRAKLDRYRLETAAQE